MKDTLKNEFKKCYNRDNKSDTKMIEYCISSSKWVELEDYYLDVGDKKPTIKNQMWYDDEKEDPGTSKARFLRYNESNKPKLLDMQNKDNFYLQRRYSKDHGEKIACIYYFDERRNSKLPDYVIRKLTLAELKLINNARQEVRTDFDKRLETYYKKYSDKIRSSGYWVNR